MTREEAIKEIKSWTAILIGMGDKCSNDTAEAQNMAIKALEQEPCDDTISRQAAIDAFEKFIHELGIEDEPYNYGKMALSIKNVQPVTPQPKIGHWIKQTLSVKPFGEDTVLCDQCAFLTDKDNCYNYCPNCGAKMQEVEE